MGETEALINILGGQRIALDILGGQLEVEVREASVKLFDKYGRHIPHSLKSDVCDFDRNFRLNQPEIATETDYANRILRLHSNLGINPNVTCFEFKQETERLLRLIRNNIRTANIVNGAWLPIILPKWEGTRGLGTVLGEQYLKAIGKSYKKAFPGRTFCNCEKSFVNKVFIASNSRHNCLIERMEQEAVIGIYFPTALQGFSIDASQECVAKLPKEFILSGLDAIIAMIMYPDILARDKDTPCLDLSALFWQDNRCSFYFKARDDRLEFDISGRQRDAHTWGSSGLLFIG
ncbi:MAG: hypothetical protein PHE59_03065 [Patescibacteria group bacterium]|nr:hypothetical protein [Patescibacteria group bacterium]